MSDVLIHASERRAWLVFCTTREHAAEVVDELIEQGIAAKYIDGDTPAPARAELLARFRAGEIRAMVNVGILTTGFDYPELDCIVLMRATASAGLYLQIVGRGQRPAPDKTNCLLLDFGGNVDRFGVVEQLADRTMARYETPEKKQPVAGSGPRRSNVSPARELPDEGLSSEQASAYALAAIDTIELDPRDGDYGEYVLVRYRLGESIVATELIGAGGSRSKGHRKLRRRMGRPVTTRTTADIIAEFPVPGLSTDLCRAL